MLECNLRERIERIFSIEDTQLHLRNDITHIDISFRIFGIKYPLDLYELVDQLKHSIVLWILQRLTNTALNHDTGHHVSHGYNHQHARQEKDDPHGPAIKKKKKNIGGNKNDDSDPLYLTRLSGNFRNLHHEKPCTWPFVTAIVAVSVRALSTNATEKAACQAHQDSQENTGYAQAEIVSRSECVFKGH